MKKRSKKVVRVIKPNAARSAGSKSRSTPRASKARAASPSPQPLRPTQQAIPDRSHILTEQRNARSMNLHALTIAEIVTLINREDESVIAAVGHALPDLASFIRAVEPFFVAEPPPRADPGTYPGRLIYLGAGTSGRLGVLDASEAPPTFHVPHGRIVGIIAGGDTALRRSSEGMEDDPNGAEDELDELGLTIADSVLGIAAGGTTPYVLGALRIAKRYSCRTGLLTCSPIPRPPACDHLIVLPTGPEILTGSTRMKAGTATKMALNIISTALMVHSGRVYENLMVDVRSTNDKLRDRAARIISTLTTLPRDAAMNLLSRAGGSVKVAVIMHRLALDRDAASARLSAAGGRLDAALATQS